MEMILLWLRCSDPRENSHVEGTLLTQFMYFIPTVSNLPPTISSTKNRTGLVVGVSVSVGAVIILTIFAVYILIRRRKRLANDEDEDFQGMGTKPNTFSYAQLRVATEDFNPMNKLREGGFGPVYKGRGTVVTGRVEQGTIKVGEDVEILRLMQVGHMGRWHLSMHMEGHACGATHLFGEMQQEGVKDDEYRK